MPQPSVDTLYHYNTASNKLEGRFTVKYPSNDKIPWHAYYEIPKYFIGDVSFPIQIDESTFSGSKPAYYMVDKNIAWQLCAALQRFYQYPESDDLSFVQQWILCH